MAEGVSYLWNAWSASEERDHYKALYRNVRELGKSNQFFRSTQGPAPRPAATGAVAVEIDGSWCNTYNADQIAFTNTSGKTLENVILRVFIQGYHGSGAHLPEAESSTEVHLHFVDVWRPGESRYAIYAARNGSGIVDDESVDIIESVQVAMASDQLCATEETKYIGPAFDADVKRFFEDAKPRFRGGWSPFKEGLIIDDDAGISLKFEGEVSSLPLAGARARLMKDGKVVESYNLSVSSGCLKGGYILGGTSWDLSKLNHLKAGDVDSLEMTLIFPRSDYEYTLNWEY